MARRDWLLILGAWLSGSLMPACSHMAADRLADAAPPQAQIGEENREVASAPPLSPYNPKSRTILKKPEPTEWHVEPVALRAGNPPVDLEPQEMPAPFSPFTPESSAGIKPLVSGETVTAAKPEDESPLLTALRCYMEKRPEDAAAILARYDKTNQDLLLRLLPLAAQLAEGRLDKADGQETKALLEQFHQLLLSLRSRAPLSIDKMCFCRQIKSFGVYEPLEEDHRFHAGETVRLYVELRNFTSEKVEPAPGQTAFVTRLNATAEIKDSTGKTVWSQEFQRDKPDHSQSPRQDYFDQYRFWLPELPPGSYTLELQVTDAATQRTVRRSLDFHMAVALPSGS